MLQEDVEELHFLRNDNKKQKELVKKLTKENNAMAKEKEKIEEMYYLKYEKLNDKLKDKKALIHEFAKFSETQLVAKNDCTDLALIKECMKRLNIYHSDVLTLKSRTTDIKQACISCKEDLEKREQELIKSQQKWKEQEVSYKLLSQQQSHMIDALRQECADYKKLLQTKKKQEDHLISLMAPPTPESDTSSVYDNVNSPSVGSISDEVALISKPAKRPINAEETATKIKSKQFKPNEKPNNISCFSPKLLDNVRKPDRKLHKLQRAHEITNEMSENNSNDTEVLFISDSSSSEDEGSKDPYQKFKLVNQPLKPSDKPPIKSTEDSSAQGILPIKGPHIKVPPLPKYDDSLDVISVDNLGSLLNSKQKSIFAPNSPISQLEVASQENAVNRNEKKCNSSIFSPKLTKKNRTDVDASVSKPKSTKELEVLVAVHALKSDTSLSGNYNSSEPSISVLKRPMSQLETSRKAKILKIDDGKTAFLPKFTNEIHKPDMKITEDSKAVTNAVPEVKKNKSKKLCGSDRIEINDLKAVDDSKTDVLPKFTNEIHKPDTKNTEHKKAVANAVSEVKKNKSKKLCGSDRIEINDLKAVDDSKTDVLPKFTNEIHKPDTKNTEHKKAVANAVSEVKKNKSTKLCGSDRIEINDLKAVDDSKTDVLPKFTNEIHKPDTKNTEHKKAVTNAVSEVKKNKSKKLCGSDRIEISELKDVNLSDSSSEEEESKYHQEKNETVNQVLNLKENQTLKNIKALVSSRKSLMSMKDILSAGVEDVAVPKPQRKLFQTNLPGKTHVQTDCQIKPSAVLETNQKSSALEIQLTPKTLDKSCRIFQGTTSTQIFASPTKEESRKKRVCSLNEKICKESEGICVELIEESCKDFYNTQLPLESTKSNQNKRNVLDPPLLNSNYQLGLGSHNLSQHTINPKATSVNDSEVILDEIFKSCQEICCPVSPLPSSDNENEENKVNSELSTELIVSFKHESKTTITKHLKNDDIKSNFNNMECKNELVERSAESNKTHKGLKSHMDHLDCRISDLKTTTSIGFEKIDENSGEHKLNVNEEDKLKSCILLNERNPSKSCNSVLDSSPNKQDNLLHHFGQRSPNSLERYDMRNIAVPRYSVTGQKQSRISTDQDKSELSKPSMQNPQKLPDLLDSDEICKYHHQVCHPLSPLDIKKKKYTSGCEHNSRLKKRSCEDSESTKQSFKGNDIIFQEESKSARPKNVNKVECGRSSTNILFKTEPDVHKGKSAPSKYSCDDVKLHSTHIDCSKMHLKTRTRVSLAKNGHSEEQNCIVIKKEKEYSLNEKKCTDSNEITLSKTHNPELDSSPNESHNVVIFSGLRSPNSLERYDMRNITVPKYYNQNQIAPKSYLSEPKLVDAVNIKYEDNKLNKALVEAKRKSQNLLHSALPNGESRIIPMSLECERKGAEGIKGKPENFELFKHVPWIKQEPNYSVLPTLHDMNVDCKKELKDETTSLSHETKCFTNIPENKSKPFKNHCKSKKSYFCFNYNNWKNPEVLSGTVNAVERNPFYVRVKNNNLKIDLLPRPTLFFDFTKTSYESIENPSLTLFEFLKNIDKKYEEELYMFACGYLPKPRYGSVSKVLCHLNSSVRRRLHQKSLIFRKAYVMILKSKNRYWDTTESNDEDDKEDDLVYSESPGLVGTLEKPSEKVDSFCKKEKSFPEHELRSTTTDSSVENEVSQESNSNALSLAITKPLDSFCNNNKSFQEHKLRKKVTVSICEYEFSQESNSRSTATNDLNNQAQVNSEEKKLDDDCDDDDDGLVIDISDDEDDSYDIKSSPASTSISTYVPTIEKTAELKPDLTYYKNMVATLNVSLTTPSNNKPKPNSRGHTTLISETDVKSTEESKSAFLPRFYTESGTKAITPCTSEKEEVANSSTVHAFPTHRIFKHITVDELSPKGENVELVGSVLRTALEHHKNNLDSYISRNVTEQRKQLHKMSGAPVDVLKILEPFINDSYLTQEKLEKLAKYNSRQILEGLVKVLVRVVEKSFCSKDAKEKSHSEQMKEVDKYMWIFNCSASALLPRKINPKAPPELHQKVKEAIGLLLAVKRWKCSSSSYFEKDYIESILEFIEEVAYGSYLLDNKEVHIRVQVFLIYIYTALARLTGAIVRVRTFIYDILYCFNFKYALLVLPVLETWEEVLPVQPIEDYYGDPIALAVIFTLTTMPRASTETKPPPRNHPGYELLRKYMSKRYRFNASTVNADELFNMIIGRPTQQDVSEALILLMKRQGEAWCKQRPLKEMLKILHSWRKGEHDDHTAAAIINILGCTVRSFNGDASQVELQPLFELLKEIMLDESVADRVKGVVAISLCRLSRVNFNSALEILVLWKPAQVPSQVIDRILVEFVMKRPRNWWNTRDILHLLHAK